MHTAISLAVTVIVGVVIYSEWANRMISAGADPIWFIFGVPLAAIAIPALLTVLWIALSWLFRAARPEEVRIGPLGLARLYGRETLAIALSVPRMIAYRWLMNDPPPAPADAPVLLLHGVMCNAGVWSPMKRHLAEQGIAPIYALSYGPPLASIDRFADQVAEKIAAIRKATGAEQLIIVGHSMGGLVARAYMRRYGSAHVRRVVTIGTPHEGSMLAKLFPGRSLAQMRPRNAWLAELRNATVERESPIVSLWSWHDSMVAPQTSSVLERAENIALMGIGHNALLTDPQVMSRVADEIKRAAHGKPPAPGYTESAVDHLAAG
jgi:pimeloyl-ACP methyl ester carboxylesterase